MILPIVAYGDPVLKKNCVDITEHYPNLNELVDNMFQTMYNAMGVGLAAPQIGLAIRLFLVDTSAFGDDEHLSEEERQTLKNFKRVFINAKLVEESGEQWAFNEGCLSIPDVREDVYRHPNITVTYYDEHFIAHTESFNGLIARVIQHEYDHIEGVLFTDKLSSFKKRLIKGRLANIAKGKINVDYRMRFHNLKKQ